MCVLVVEDNVDVCVFLKNMLMTKDYKVDVRRTRQRCMKDGEI